MKKKMVMILSLSLGSPRQYWGENGGGVCGVNSEQLSVSLSYHYALLFCFPSPKNPDGNRCPEKGGNWFLLFFLFLLCRQSPASAGSVLNIVGRLMYLKDIDGDRPQLWKVPFFENLVVLV